MRIFIDIVDCEGEGGSNFVPARVQNVQAVDIEGAVEVSWDELTGLIVEEDGEVVKYIIEKKVNEGAWNFEREIEEEDWVAGFFIMDLNVEAGNTYYYRIKAQTNLGKESAWSGVASITLEEDEPTVPETIPFANISSERSFNYNHIFWTPAGDGGSAITAYAIQRVGAGVLADDLQEPEYIDITSSTEFFTYNVAAINAVGQGAWSNGIGSSIISNLDWWRPVLTVISSNRIDIAVNNAAEWGNKIIDHYWDIQRSTDQSNWATIASNQTDVYQDDELEASTTYYYRIIMKNEHGSSSASNIRNATTQAESPEVFNAPLLSAEIDIDNQNGIFTTWTPNPENTVAADYYEFEKIEEDGSPSISGAFSGAGGTAKDSVVTAGKVYKYRCRGHHSVHGYTPWSDQVTINLIYLNREYDFTYPSPVQDVALGAAYVYFPEAYRKNPTAEFPVIVYCHGQGERAGGTSPNFTTLANGAGFTKELRGKSNEIPVIAICPQVVGWGSFATEGMIDECVAAVINDLGLPLQHKFVLSGYSAGGNDTWPYVRDHDNTNVVGFIPFACRLYIPSGNAQVQDYLDRELPTWIFHNINDTTQEPTNHIGFLNTVFTLDPDNDFIRGTIYDLSGHDPVTRTINTLGGDVVEGYYPYKNAGNELYDWIADVYFGNIPEL